MPDGVSLRPGVVTLPGGPLLALAAAALLACWYVWIFAPSLDVERSRVATGDLVQRLQVTLRAVDTLDEARARELVVAARGVLPALQRLDETTTGPLAQSVQGLEDALRLGTYEIGLHRATLDALRQAQWQLVTRSQRNLAESIRSSERLSLLIVALVIIFGALAAWIRLRPRATSAILLLGREQLGQLLFDVSPEAVSVADRDERILAINPAFLRVTGYAADEVIGQQLTFNASGEQDDDFLRRLRGELAATGQWTGEIWQRRKTGEAYAEKVTRVRINDDAGVACGFLTVSMDLSANKDAERLITWQAHHDALTKLPNRTLLHERLTRVLVPRHNRIDAGALLSVDIDRFKQVNDSIGPNLGDRLLIEAAMRIAMAAREGDTVARLGSDEFAVMLPNLADYAEAERMARAIQTALKQLFSVEQKEIFVTASVGIAMFPVDGTKPDALIQNSNTALARAKELGGNTVVFYESDMNARARRRLEVETDLRRALRARQLLLHYQPIIDQRSMRVVSAEALMRWAHPHQGVISPGEFIPIAEETGLIVEMGYWLVEEVGAQIASWREAGLADMRLSINVSGRQLQQPLEMRRLVDLLRAAPTDLLTVEITESVLMNDNAAVFDLLMELRGLGVRIALDDFGTGFSSFSYLRKFHFDVLKIDRSFIRDVERSNTDLGLVASIASMERILGVEVVAEGVETQAQLNCLRGVGCDLIQGFLFGRPMPADEFLAFTRGFGASKKTA